MNKFLIALLAFSALATPAIADTNQFNNWKHNRHAGVDHRVDRRVDRRHDHWHGDHNDGHNYWHGNHHNYWHGNNNNNFYNDPNFWGGVAGGLIGGAIIGNQYDEQPIAPERNCFTALQPIYDPYYGNTYREIVICN